jgi:hypothetical protein
MLYSVTLVRTNVSGEHIAFMNGMTRIGELGIALAVTSYPSRVNTKSWSEFSLTNNDAGFSKLLISKVQLHPI